MEEKQKEREKKQMSFQPNRLGHTLKISLAMLISKLSMNAEKMNDDDIIR